MWVGKHLIHTTANGTEIYVCQGKLSEFDFRVQYRKPGIGNRVRTPKHIHLIIDLFLKRAGNDKLTSELTTHIIENIIRKVGPSTSIPPNLQVYSPRHVARFKSLDEFGEYSVEFLLVAVELIVIQEKTNYLPATSVSKLYQAFHDRRDIFSVVSAATFGGRGKLT
jgi:hypothetical protein